MNCGRTWGLTTGKSPAEVEKSLVDEYGERILATPHEGFLDPLGFALLVTTAIALLILFTEGRRRLLARRPSPEHAPEVVADEGARARLTEELASMDP